MKKYIAVFISLAALMLAGCKVNDPGDFYVEVTDCEGNDKIIFYMSGDEENDPIAYMENPMDDPESMFGYISLVSTERPAKTGEVFFGKKLKKFIEDSGLEYMDSRYDVSQGATSSGTVVDRVNNEGRFDRLIDALVRLEPEYVPELADSEPDTKSEYLRRYPLRSVYISDENSGLYINSYVEFVFRKYNDRIISRMYIADYSKIQKLIKSGKQPPSAKKLEKAYYKSTYSVSDWFYADGTEFYDYALKCVLLSDGNNISGVRQDRSDSGYDSRAGFSENLEAYFDTSGKIPDGYGTEQFKDVYFVLPSDGEVLMSSDKLFMWKYGGNDDIIFKISKTETTSSGKDVLVSEHGKFNNDSCEYYSYSNKNTDVYEDELHFRDSGGRYWDALFRLDSPDRTEEYDTIVKNVLGSISLYDPREPISDAEIKLASEPSVYADSSEIAEGYTDGNDVYKAYSSGRISAEFYIVDFNNNYETSYECYLEKQEADGLWYRVEPVGEIRQSDGNDIKHFCNVFENERRKGVIDLDAYPPLPYGKYRIAKPFWEEGSSDHEQYMAFYEFRMDDKVS